MLAGKNKFFDQKTWFFVVGIKNLVFWFEILSFLIQIRVSHQKTRFFDRNTRIFDQKTRFFYGNTRFFKDMWEMASIHTNQGKGFSFFWFQAFTWLVLCCWRSWSWRKWLKPRELQRKYLKIWSWETYRFLWNM